MGRIIPLLLLLTAPMTARGDIGLLLHESTGRGMSRFTSAGHAAVYFSNICMATPTALRLCEAGESGSVMGNYITFGEIEPYEWNIVSLTEYLYGVDDRKNIPLYGNAELLRLLQDAYREKYLSSVCPASPCGDASSDAHWRDMVGSTFARDIYCFRVKTTREQDAAIVQQFNALPNVNRYNGFTNNCADFTRGIVNTWFPGAAKRDHLNDFGMTSPKAIAKSFTRFGEKHPELMFSIEKFAQLPGPIPRSADCRKGTEVGFRMKKWLIPMLLRPHELGAFIAMYAVSGRFNPEHAYRKHASQPAQEWSDYRTRFQPILDGAVRDGIFHDRRAAALFFKELAREGTTELDSTGAPRIRLGQATVGLTRESVLASGSDPRLAFKLMLAKVDATLKYPSKNRVTLPQFQSDWDLLTRLQEAARLAPQHGQ